MTWRPRGKLVLAALYGVLLLASHVTGACRGPGRPEPGEVAVRLARIDGERSGDRDVRMVLFDLAPERAAGTEPVVLLHGSPGSKRDLGALAERLANRRRVLVPDLPGFGASDRDLPDYSAAAGADYVADMLRQLGVERAHVVGFSMGGVVAVELLQREPSAVASLTLLSATGVQELELLGEYRLNHLVHGAQLALLWIAQHGLPHFGAWDDAYLDVAYARNFFDTDPRGVRGALSHWDGPTLIVHGRNDVLVPIEAAREHRRIVPHSDLRELDANHFLPFTKPGIVAGLLDSFFDRVEAGTAPRRDAADPERIAAARRPFDPSSIPAASGLALVLLALLLAVATLVSEDLACIGAGLMVAHGRIELLPAVIACLAGIVVGDAGLFLAGRWLGRPALRRAPLKWILRPEKLERSRAWLERRGFIVILLSRFAPGSRLPTYFVAGTLGMRLRVFAAYFLVAAAAWTPALVGVSAVAGRRALEWLEGYRRVTLPILLVVGMAVLVAVRTILPLATFRGRRRFVGWLRRWTRWEFWPRWLFYPPVVLYVGYLTWRSRHRAAFTASNPAIDAGGFVGESKAEILEGLAGSPEAVADWRLVPGPEAADRRLAMVRAVASRHGWPLVLKPDQGQRGDGVRVVRSEDEARAYLEASREPVIAQEYVAGVEFGLFYARRPGRQTGEIFSVTEKVLPEVEGDGRSTLERLILAHPRHVAMASVYLERLAGDADRVPAEGERVRLVDLGTHCRGAVFLDGARVLTPSLEQAVDRIARGFRGFSFGRFDVRATTEDDLRRGRFKILELNGVTSEATHIYDPSNGLLEAYRVLFRQWRLAFEIGEAHADAGHPTVPPSGLLARLRGYREQERRRTAHDGAV